MPCATTAIADIERFLASIIFYPRTLNQYVFAYGEHVIQQRYYVVLAHEITGEDVPVIRVTKEQVLDLAHQPEMESFMVWQKVIVQYLYNNWCKGDNEASYAKYLGYLDARELCPELEGNALRLMLVTAWFLLKYDVRY
ncbi:hypothetical protein P170DRAFT_430177 [Aspergillus steynii IBT 23096]|uniref:Uncharacterized protein n=1 Tax=Aspergillus steynii IBT 23096 TaxID=1392250 RepID=A0A2I2FUH5_9EURO|nr:uncharacterized protein P170DRAFT_430177 [Aspergillus steynii IBT 23096]PLB44274.1 hypothetical protein P170DRAFT_430177 [Aspergillus steynii IBT 23096]